MKRKETPSNRTNPPPGRLAYTAKELSQLMGISTKTLRRLELRGLLKPSRALRKKLYSATAVTAFLADNT